MNFILIFTFLAFTGCAGKPDLDATHRELAQSKDFQLYENQLKIAEQLVSIFENDTPYIQYSYAEKLEDWKDRGITFGRAGFTTCQDGKDMLSELSKINPEHELLGFRPYIYDTEDNSHECVTQTNLLMNKKFIKIFKKYGSEQQVIIAENKTYEKRYLDPSLRLMNRLHLKNFLTFVVILDTYIQHGAGGPSGIETILAAPALDSLPRNPEQERAWLELFLDRRKSMLQNGDDEWIKSVPRVYELKILVQKYFDQPHRQVEIDSKEYGHYILPVRARNLKATAK